MRDSSSELERNLERQLSPEFEIVRRLGGGKLSTVFLAREPALQRLVAVKVLHADAARHPKRLARFRREAMALATISHPNVVSIFRIGDLSSAAPYLVMQYVRGRDLRERLQEDGSLAEDEARSVLASIAAALAAVHRHGLAHRDVRPQSILCEHETGRVLLADFGLAAALADSDAVGDRLTTTGHVVTDYRFSSPEVLGGMEPTSASDIYSLGILGYHLLAGRGPYPASGAHAQVRAHLVMEPLPLASYGLQVSPELEDLLRSCLAKDPTRRPTTEAVGQALGTPADSRPEAVEDAAGVARIRERSAQGERSPRYVMKLLGGLDLVSVQDRVSAVLRQPKRFALLAYLAAGMASGFRRRDTLLGIFWPGAEPESGRHSLRQALYVLRRDLGTDVVRTRGDEEVGLEESLISCDSARFEELARAGSTREALDLYEGDFMPGFYLVDAPEFERWLEVERLRLRRLASSAAWTQSSQAADAADPREASAWARKAVDLDPFDETALHRLIVMLDAQGDRAGALTAYDHFARRLEDEYAVEPSPETRRLIESVRSRH